MRRDTLKTETQQNHSHPIMVTNVVQSERDSNTFISSIPCHTVRSGSFTTLIPCGGMADALILIMFPRDMEGEPKASGGTNGFTRTCANRNPTMHSADRKTWKNASRTNTARATTMILRRKMTPSLQRCNVTRYPNRQSCQIGTTRSSPVAKL
jgi:hypothetical protein